VADASNATFLCRVAVATPNDPDAWPEDEPEPESELAIYKPTRGERPLDDFPSGTLAHRELAAHLVSQAAGWNIVPPTVMRDGPFGPGMCQLWIDIDTTVNLVDVLPPRELPPGWRHVLDALGSIGEPVVLGHADDARLRRMAVLDAVINNADRKGGHVLPTPEGQVLGVDHGVCFHVETKLRTVLWGWAGEPLNDEETEVLRRLMEQLCGDLGARLAALLTPAEVRATQRRATRLVSDGCFRLPGEGWPSIPWPPF
jgi:uncharacterized repeat protein (TIGR03843 family)